MAHRVLDSVQQIATGTGTGALTLGTSTGGKFRTLQAAGLADGDTTYVRVQHTTIDAEWECVKVTRSGSTIVRAFDARSASPTGALINFSAGNKTVTSALLAAQAVTVDAAGDVTIPGNLNIGGTANFGFAAFTTALADAWANDKVLNWMGGDVTITAPIVLQATANKLGFGLRGNGMHLISNFADATKYAITIEVPVVSGSVLSNINVRNFTIQDIHFTGSSAFKGAVELRCLTNSSWINTFTMANLVCEGHSNYAYYWNGSIFECRLDLAKSTGGVGGLNIERADLSANNDFGLPSAMELNYPNFRDGSGAAINLTCRIAFQEPHDLSVKGGYLVTLGGVGIEAPAGITVVDNLGIENIDGGYGLNIGYRGGLIKGNTRGANPIAGATVGPPVNGMRYLVNWWAATGVLVLEDLKFENEGSGTGMTLGKVSGSGTVYMNRCGAAGALDNSGCTILVADYS